MLCLSGLSGRAYILPSPIVSSDIVSCIPLSPIVSSGVVSERTIRPSIHSTFDNSVVWCCIRADYQAEHTFYRRQYCRLVLCQSGLSGRAYILPSPMVSSGVMCLSGLSDRAYILPSPIIAPGVVSEWTIRPSIHSTCANSVVKCCARCCVCCCVKVDNQAEPIFYFRH